MNLPPDLIPIHNSNKGLNELGRTRWTPQPWLISHHNLQAKWQETKTWSIVSINLMQKMQRTSCAGIRPFMNNKYFVSSLPNNASHTMNSIFGGARFLHTLVANESTPTSWPLSFMVAKVRDETEKPFFWSSVQTIESSFPWSGFFDCSSYLKISEGLLLLRIKVVFPPQNPSPGKPIVPSHVEYWFILLDWQFIKIRNRNLRGASPTQWSVQKWVEDPFPNSMCIAVKKMNSSIDTSIPVLMISLHVPPSLGTILLGRSMLPRTLWIELTTLNYMACFLTENLHHHLNRRHAFFIMISPTPSPAHGFGLLNYLPSN